MLRGTRTERLLRRINDAFRLDFAIAIAALLVSGVSAIALIYQTRVIGDQYASTIWPYLTVTNDFDGRRQQIVVSNDGTGPALIHYAQLEIDGRPASSWAPYLDRMQSAIERADPRGRSSSAFSVRGIGAGSTLRAGASLTLFSASLPSSRGAAFRAIVEPRLAMHFCYCSLNGSCWSMESSSANPIASYAPVRACPTAIITALKSAT